MPQIHLRIGHGLGPSTGRVGLGRVTRVQIFCCHGGSGRVRWCGSHWTLVRECYANKMSVVESLHIWECSVHIPLQV